MTKILEIKKYVYVNCIPSAYATLTFLYHSLLIICKRMNIEKTYYLYLKLIYQHELTSLEASNAFKKRHTTHRFNYCQFQLTRKNPASNAFKKRHTTHRFNYCQFQLTRKTQLVNQTMTKTL